MANGYAFNRLTAGALSALIFMASAGPLLAQSAPGPTAQPSSAAADHSPRAIELVEKRISELHKKLRITAEQDPQFKAYADVMRSNAEAMQALFQERAKATGPRGMDHADSTLRWYAKLTAAHADAVSKLVPVFDTLYQSLSDKQKKTADAIFQELRQRRHAHRAG